MSGLSGNGATGRQAKPAALIEMCSVRVGDGMFAVAIRHILEIIGGARPQPVPLAPPHIGGLVHYRGDVLTTVSLRYLLDLPMRQGPQDILVIESVEGSFGLLVDSVGEVLTVSMADHEPNPSTLGERRKAFFIGAYKLANSLLVLLDAEKLEPMRLARSAAQSDPAELDVAELPQPRGTAALGAGEDAAMAIAPLRRGTARAEA